MASENKVKTFTNNLPGYQWLLEHSHLLQLARVAYLGSKKDSVRHPGPLVGNPRSSGDMEGSKTARVIGEGLFRRLAAWCAKRNVHLLITTTGWHTPPYTDPSEPTIAFMSIAESFFANLGIPFADPSEILWKERRRNEGKYAIPGDGHPSEAGAALIAEDVLPFIQTQLVHYCQLTNRCDGD